MRKLCLSFLILVIASPANAITKKISTQNYFKDLPLNTSNWETEIGTRLWFSNGTLGAPQPLLNSPPVILASRLTYDDLDAYSGEIFGRLEHKSGWFLKGFLGTGGIVNGNLYDEDFPAGPVYSRTLSTSLGSLAYANADIGYTLARTSSAKLSAFIGYNYYAQAINTTDCAQLAGSTVCHDGDIPFTYPGITEYDHFNSIRLGVTTQFNLTNRLQFTGEAAYLPKVNFTGRDDHNARMLILPESSSDGDGVMLESIFNYKVTDSWNIGVGGRYWAWNTHNGNVFFDFLNIPGPALIEPARYNATRYGVFIQTSYSDDSLPVLYLSSSQMNWQGITVGANLGGAWSTDQWSNPFDSTKAGAFINVNGFGDTIHATGPVAGGQIGYNWQLQNWVLGIDASGRWSDIRGENTCFSGLGGVNCQRIITALGTFTGKVGIAWDQSLFYLKGGRAWTSTAYKINGNTNAITLGTGSNTLIQWGWEAGLGLAQALTEHWFVQAEYNYIMIPTSRVAFGTVNLVNAQNISISQNINLFDISVNYRF